MKKAAAACALAISLVVPLVACSSSGTTSSSGEGGGTGTGTGTGDGNGDGNGNGTGGGNGTGAARNVCGLFYDGWDDIAVTLYQPDKEPIVGSISGTAFFNRDGTYELSYSISTGIHYKGKYEIAGDRLKTYDEEGEEVFDFKFSCGDDTKVLVLTLEDDAGKPEIVYGLESRKK